MTVWGLNRFKSPNTQTPYIVSSPVKNPRKLDGVSTSMDWRLFIDLLGKAVDNIRETFILF